jgi:hypothetical protein
VADTADPALFASEWRGEITHVYPPLTGVRPETALVNLDRPLPDGRSTAWLFRRNRLRLLRSDFVYVVPCGDASRDLDGVDILKETVFVAEVRRR